MILVFATTAAIAPGNCGMWLYYNALQARLQMETSCHGTAGSSAKDAILAHANEKGPLPYIALNATSDTRNTTISDDEMIAAKITVRRNINRLASL